MKDEDKFKENDKINYVITKRMSKNKYSISAKDGIFVKYCEDDVYSIVKTKNGRLVIAKTSNIRHRNKKNALTEAIVKGCSSEKL